MALEGEERAPWNGSQPLLAEMEGPAGCLSRETCSFETEMECPRFCWEEGRKLECEPEHEQLGRGRVEEA